MDFVAVDWGTSNRRVFEIAGGVVTATREDDQGILNCADFAGDVASIRAAAGGAPVLLAGMIGSNRGWVEVPYVAAPAGLSQIAAAVTWVQPGVGIVPGVSYSDNIAADVMRGEEVQVLGALALGEVGDGLLAHPGTHGKWIEVEDGRINRFRTVMTGDVFAALKAKSILSDLLQGEAGTGPAFVAGVDHGLAHGDLLAELFSVRARVLLGQAAKEDAASYVSGLLIGNEVSIGLGRRREPIVPVIGTAALSERFAVALDRAGRTARIVDGEDAFVAGMIAIMGATR
ncbi:2-dehydro-3-deoxygalactonokinase [Glacieibacterium frigidum]|uniref:2-dehydro-3-deoxygalactonokinase n=1 Tax=Glacieibacterium frigidum TaxID=2593303 RepID=A0A552UFH1_9SPHN|nr:2-dehydro-3-deoxygalactonokinase [Glacieibacterium frigidum]TRW16977.1 2-dehydro-3-deoxygalactonokinase [Glacieibacterium frigidum]